MYRLIATMLAAWVLLITANAPAADAPELLPPQVKFTGVKVRDGHSFWTFDVANANDVAVPYVGYTSDSFEGGLSEGTSSPIYRVQLQRAGEWKDHSIGFCGTGIGPAKIASKSKVTFEVVPPAGDWTAARVGLSWYDAADTEEKPSIAWSKMIQVGE